MALNDLIKPNNGNAAFSNSQVKTSARASRTGAPARAGDKALPAKLNRLARPGRNPDFYLGDEGSEASRSGAVPGGLSAPKATAARAIERQTPPRMQPVSNPTHASAPRALELADVHGDAQALQRMPAGLHLVQVQGDALAGLVTALLHHGAKHPERAARVAEGLQNLEEPTGEIAPKAHAGFAMLKRWAHALNEGRGAEVLDKAFKHPDVLAAMTLAMRGIVRHMQVFGTLKRPAKEKATSAGDMDAMQALASLCGLKVAVHGAAVAAPVETDGSTLNFLARGGRGPLDVLVPA